MSWVCVPPGLAADLLHHFGPVWQSGLLAGPAQHRWTCAAFLAQVPGDHSLVGAEYPEADVLESLKPEQVREGDAKG